MLEHRGCRAAIVAGVAILSSSFPAAHADAARHGSVVIKRDDYGIPAIFADDTYSLYYGWGYALAEDRLFQIESVRRASQGRAAEVFGEDYLERDRQMLVNYDPDSLRPQLAQVKGEHLDALDGMAAGINRRIDEVLADPQHLLPKPFNDYGFRPGHWERLDVAMSWVGLLLFEFSDYTSQISNASFLADLKARHDEAGAARIFASLRWKFDPTAPSTVKKIDQQEGRASRAMPGAAAATRVDLEPISRNATLDAELQSIALWQGSGPDRTPSASNTWIANRTKLIDADAILVSGPQIGDRVPSMIWSASLHGAGLHVTGLTYPGLPYLHFGTNGDIAWGRTALAGSVIDIYQEQLNPADPHQYRYRGKWHAMEKRALSIRVRGRPDPVTSTAYSTVHGPVLVFDAKNHTAYSKKRSWAGYEIQTMLAYYDEMKARNFEEWSAAIARKANNQNQYYADKGGNIGYIQAGRYPLRPGGFEIQLPTPGTGEREWLGIQPKEYNFRVLNPKQGYIDNWNNRPAPDMLNTDTLLWSKLHRVDAITEQFEASTKLTIQEVWDINRHASFASEQHRYFVPLLRDAVSGLPADDRARLVAESITVWDGQENDPTLSGYYASPGYTAFYGWMGAALTKFFARDLPEKYLKGCDAEYSSLNCPYGQPLGGSVLYFALTGGKTGSPIPEYDFLHGQSPTDFIRETLAEADRTLSARYGADIGKWLSETEAKTWINRSAMRVPWAAPDEKFTHRPDQKRGAMNAMYVFRNGTVTMCDAAPPGQSGFIAPDGKADPHYRDQQSLYVNFGCKPRRMTAAEVDAHKTSERKLSY